MINSCTKREKQWTIAEFNGEYSILLPPVWWWFHWPCLALACLTKSLLRKGSCLSGSPAVWAEAEGLRFPASRPLTPCSVCSRDDVVDKGNSGGCIAVLLIGCTIRLSMDQWDLEASLLHIISGLNHCNYIIKFKRLLSRGLLILAKLRRSQFETDEITMEGAHRSMDQMPCEICARIETYMSDEILVWMK